MFGKGLLLPILPSGHTLISRTTYIFHVLMGQRKKEEQEHVLLMAGYLSLQGPASALVVHHTCNIRTHPHSYLMLLVCILTPFFCSLFSPHNTYFHSLVLISFPALSFSIPPSSLPPLAFLPFFILFFSLSPHPMSKRRARRNWI